MSTKMPSGLCGLSNVLTNVLFFCWKKKIKLTAIWETLVVLKWEAQFIVRFLQDWIPFFFVSGTFNSIETMSGLCRRAQLTFKKTTREKGEHGWHFLHKSFSCKQTITATNHIHCTISMCVWVCVRLLPSLFSYFLHICVAAATRLHFSFT